MTSTPMTKAYHGQQPETPGSCPPPPPPVSWQTRRVGEEEERAITRHVLQLLAELHPVTVRDGRIVVPDDAAEELLNRIRAVEGELLWALGKESGPRWGCSWVPARPPEPPWKKTVRS